MKKIIIYIFLLINSITIFSQETKINWILFIDGKIPQSIILRGEFICFENTPMEKIIPFEYLIGDIKISENDSRVARLLSALLNSFISVLLGILFLFSVYHLFEFRLSINLSGIVNLEGFGILGLISLTILPLCWQFVDLTNWQRYETIRNIRRETKRIRLV